MSKRELWEIVRANELKVGDLMRQSVKERPFEIEWINRGRSSVMLNDSRGYLFNELVFRRIPDADEAAVLRKTVEIMHARGNLRWDVEEWIEIARRELESEGSDER